MVDAGAAAVVVVELALDAGWLDEQAVTAISAAAAAIHQPRRRLVSEPIATNVDPVRRMVKKLDELS